MGTGKPRQGAARGQRGQHPHVPTVSPPRWTPAGPCWSCRGGAVPGRSTFSAWSRSWRCPTPSSWCSTPTARGSGGCRASPRGHTPSRAGEPPAPRPLPWRTSLRGLFVTCRPPRRLPLPEPWRGLRDEALSLVTGVPGCVFVHASGFTGGNRTREGALEMARRTLALRDGGGAQSG